MSKGSLHAIWTDPLAFNVLENGPPYLPETGKVRLATTTEPDQKVFANLMGHLNELPMAELGALLAVLKAAAHIHQTHHWQTRGLSFYGDHLLFQRLYDESLEFIDQVAERAVGSGHPDLVSPTTQMALINNLTHSWVSEGDEALPIGQNLAVNSLNVELSVVGCISAAKNSLEAKGVLSDGTDNLLQGVADKHEEFVYLLRQRTYAEAPYSYDRS